MTYNEDRRRLQERLGYHFRDLDLLATALTHSSAVPDLRAAAEAAGSTAAMIRDNERLEFLGDAVLDLLASEYLVERFPDWSEGQLSRSRSYLVNAQALVETARRLASESFCDWAGEKRKPAAVKKAQSSRTHWKR